MNIKNVAPSGNDSFDGSSFSKAYRTINKGISQLSPGDKLIVYGIDGDSFDYTEGITNGFPSIPFNSGSWSNPTTIEVAEDHEVYLVPPVGTDYAVLFSQTGQEFIQIIGLNIDAMNTNYGIMKVEGWSGGNPHHIRLKDCKILGTLIDNAVAQGIICDAQVAGQIGGNEFINVNLSRVSGDDFSHGIYIKSGGNLVDSCNIYDVPGACVHLYATYVADGNIITRNRIHDIRATSTGQRHWGIISTDNCPNTIILSNIVFNIPNDGASSVGIYLSQNADGAKIGNNTITQCQGVGLQVDPTVNGVVVRNNIIFGNGTNLVPGSSAASNNIQSDPLFVNPLNNDFTITKNSPAFHAGVKISGWTKDALMNPYDDPPSCGAYEVGGANMTQSIPLGMASPIIQNVPYALPSSAVILMSDAPVDVSQSIGGPWSAYTAGSFTAGSFIRCASGNTIVTAKH